MQACAGQGPSDWPQIDDYETLLHLGISYSVCGQRFGSSAERTRTRMDSCHLKSAYLDLASSASRFRLFLEVGDALRQRSQSNRRSVQLGGARWDISIYSRYCGLTFMTCIGFLSHGLEASYLLLLSSLLRPDLFMRCLASLISFSHHILLIQVVGCSSDHLNQTSTNHTVT